MRTTNTRTHIHSHTYTSIYLNMDRCTHIYLLNKHWHHGMLYKCHCVWWGEHQQQRMGQPDQWQLSDQPSVTAATTTTLSLSSSPFPFSLPLKIPGVHYSRTSHHECMNVKIPGGLEYLRSAWLCSDIHCNSPCPLFTFLHLHSQHKSTSYYGENLDKSWRMLHLLSVSLSIYLSIFRIFNAKGKH